MGLGTSNNNHLPLESPTFKKNPPSTINAHTHPLQLSHIKGWGGGEGTHTAQQNPQPRAGSWGCFQRCRGRGADGDGDGVAGAGLGLGGVARGRMSLFVVDGGG